jgi:hypothetical protein
MERKRLGQRGVRVGPYAVLLSIRSCGQAIAVELLRFLARGIVWANRSICWILLKNTYQFGMPTWHALTRGAV